MARRAQTHMLPAVQILKSFTFLSNKEDYFFIPHLMTGLEVYLRVCLLLFFTYQLLIVQRNVVKFGFWNSLHICKTFLITLLISHSPIFFFSVYHSLFNSKYYEALALDFCGDLPHPEQPSLLVPAAF